MQNRIVAAALLGVALLVIGVAPSYAQATRTWVSGVGDDANPCSRTAPCKTFAGAISKTAANGEISVLDPGGFGAVTITKSISIVSDGSEGSILACSANGVIINAAATDAINLHGLFFEGCGNGINGIRILSAGVVHIRHCLIRGFSSAGAAGILVAPSSANVKVTVSNCTLSRNSNGILVDPTAPGQASVMIERSVIDNNGNIGVRASTANGTVQLSNSVVTNNAKGLLIANSGTIVSFGNNSVVNNTANETPTSTIPTK